METLVFSHQRIVGAFKAEIVFNAIVFFVESSCKFTSNTHKSRLMELVVSNKERNGNNLQHQEEQEIEIPSDEEKNITHKRRFINTKH